MRMDEAPLLFLAAESVLISVGFMIAAFVSPPDPVSQVLGLLVILAVTLPVSYWWAYRRQTASDESGAPSET